MTNGIKFQGNPDRKSGWLIDPAVLEEIRAEMDAEYAGLSLEQVEAVLLVLVDRGLAEIVYARA